MALKYSRVVDNIGVYRACLDVNAIMKEVSLPYSESVIICRSMTWSMMRRRMLSVRHSMAALKGAKFLTRILVLIRLQSKSTQHHYY